MTGVHTFAESSTPDDVRPETNRTTPYRVFRREVALERIAAVAALRDALRRPPIGLVSAYSFKTNPQPEMIAAARAHGFFAEVISPQELDWALQAGFEPAHTIYNGPQPLAEPAAGSRIGIAFADSLEALAWNGGQRIGRLRGVRLRPSMITSRFGVTIEDDRGLTDIAGLEPQAPFAISFHARREDFHGATWREVAGDVVGRAAAIQQTAKRPIVAFDVGGGWTPAQFDADFAGDMAWLIDRVGAELPACERLIFEAGQAVCTPSEAIVTEVLEIRERRGRREAVIDAGYPDWPQMHTSDHGLYAWRGNHWEAFGRGPDRLLGRTCLEYDLVEGLRFPLHLRQGDRVLITGTGAYDHSMAFDFARGREQRPAAR